MGESVTEGAIVEWRKAVGDFVAEGDPLVEVTTDKVDVEVPATVSGVVTQIAAKEGETVAVGSLLAKIDTSKSNGAAKKSVAKKNGAAAATAQPVAATPTPAPAVATSGEIVADVAAQRAAQRLDVDLKLVRGSGPNGLILRSDVESQAASARRRSGPAAAPSPPLPPGAKTTALRGPAAALTGYMEQSLTIPTATSFRTINVTYSTRVAMNSTARCAAPDVPRKFRSRISSPMHGRAPREQCRSSPIRSGATNTASRRA